MMAVLLPWLGRAQFTVTTNTDNTLTLTGYGGTNRNVTIPNAIAGLPVSIIGASAFSAATITNVVIPDSVTNIESGAFENCSQLLSVNIPDSVTSLGDYAFEGCASLSSVALSTNIPAIGWQAFANCRRLTGITIPDSVTNLGDYAFLYSGLTNVFIPTNVSRIGYWAFNGCTNLMTFAVESGSTFFSSVGGVLCDQTGTQLLIFPEGRAGSYVIPGSVTNISRSAFGFCPGLTNVTIPNTVSCIGTPAFYYASGLRSITVQAGNVFYSSAAGVLFNQDQTVLIRFPEGKTESYTFPNSVTNIGAYAFYNNAWLTNIVIPDNVTVAGVSAFAYCPSLISATIGDGLTTIPANLFEGCIQLRTVTIGRHVTSIGDSAFSICLNLTNLYFESNAPSAFGQWAFFDCPPFTAYYLPGTTGWNVFNTAALWQPVILTADGRFGLQTNQFGFNLNWVSGQTVVVESCTNLANPVWQPLQTNTLTSSTVYFSDSPWTNFTQRFYRLRVP